MVLTASFELSPVIGLSCHRRRQKPLSANLTPASRRQDHTTSPSAFAPFVLKAPKRPPHPAPTSVTIAKRPSLWARDGASYEFDLGESRSEIFLQEGLDSRSAAEPVGQITGRAARPDVTRALRGIRFFVAFEPRSVKLSATDMLTVRPFGAKIAPLGIRGADDHALDGSVTREVLRGEGRSRMPLCGRSRPTDRSFWP